MPSEEVGEKRPTCSGGADTVDDDRSTSGIGRSSISDGTLDALTSSHWHGSSTIFVRMYVRPSVDIDSVSCVIQPNTPVSVTDRLMSAKTSGTCVNGRVFTGSSSRCVTSYYSAVC